MASTAAAWVNPDAFVGRPVLSVYEPYPIITSTAYSSLAPASIEFCPWVLQAPATFKNVVVGLSMNVSVPQASSQNSSGSEGYTYAYSAFIFSRQDYLANSTNISYVTSGLFGLTATQSYSSSSQTYGFSWLTDTTGGTSGVSTTSNAGNWSSSGSGAKQISIPLVATLPAGEYFFGFQHSSTAGTSGSSVVLHSFSKLIQQWPINSQGVLGETVSRAWFNPDGAGMGIASAITTNATMAITVISASAQPLVYFVLSNA